MQIIQSIQNRIYEIRGERVMLDFDLASLYDVQTKVFNQSVKRNSKRFPGDFMFQLTREVWASLKVQVINSTTQNIDNQYNQRSQIVTLNSDRAIKMNIAIMRAFVELGKVLLSQADFKEQLKELKERVGNHDVQLNQISMRWKTYWMKKHRNENGQTEEESVLKNRSNKILWKRCR